LVKKANDDNSSASDSDEKDGAKIIPDKKKAREGQAGYLKL
jgi:hypothetical protein